VRSVLVLIDFVALLLALEIAFVARYSLGWSLTGEGSSLDPLVPPLCLAVALIAYRLFDMYSMQLVGSGLNEYRAVVTNTTFAFAAIVVLTYIDQNLPVSRAFLLLFWLAAILLVGAGRFIARRVVRRWSAMRGGLRRVLVVGANEQGVQIAQELARNPAACSVVLGFLSEYRPTRQSANGRLSVLGDPMQIYEVARRVGATHAVVVESSLSWESLRYIVRSMHASRDLEVLLAPGLFDVSATPLKYTQLGRALLLAPRATRIVGIEAIFKRLLDLGLAMPTLVVTLPVQLGIWVYLWATGIRGPVESVRAVGYRGQPLTIRRLAGGQRLRASHLTRLPSLWLVITGKMSLIGPRPLTEADTGPYERWRDVLMALKPGFVGPWWLSGQGRPLAVQDEIEADLHYARSYSVWMDLRILIAVSWKLAVGWTLRPATAGDRQHVIGAVNAGEKD
jgi:lipopolysaccharide/colanic/teichoic acid biosynthesis glycosyltransferase